MPINAICQTCEMYKLLHFPCNKKTDFTACPHWKVKNKEDELRDLLQEKFGEIWLLKKKIK
jgi:hypothetical protein